MTVRVTLIYSRQVCLGKHFRALRLLRAITSSLSWIVMLHKDLPWAVCLGCEASVCSLPMWSSKSKSLARIIVSSSSITE
jgi:hypothetical protein